MSFRIFLIASCLFFSSASGAKGFPAKPVKIVVYTKPGGAIDVFSRKFAAVAERISGKKFLIVNNPGAGGIVALKKLAKARPDGYMIAAVTKSNIGKIVSSKGKVKIDQFTWLAMMVRDPEAVIVHRKSNLTDWKAVLAEAKKSPGRQKWLGPAKGGNDHITARKIWKKTGVDAKWVPYAGGGKAMAALLGGHGAVYVGNPGDVIGKEDLKVIAVSSASRLEGQFASVPTFKEAGISGLDREIMWRGFIGPKKMPQKAKVFFGDLLKKVSEDREWRDYISSRGAEPVLEGSTKFRQQAEADYEEFKSVLNSLGRKVK